MSRACQAVLAVFCRAIGDSENCACRAFLWPITAHPSNLKKSTSRAPRRSLFMAFSWSGSLLGLYMLYEIIYGILHLRL
jgi:hypothetical protein